MKRFTETDKWRDAWFRKLSPALKCLWQYLVDNCDQAGVIDIDWELASFQIGAPLSPKDLAAFDRQVSTLTSGKLWIRSFVRFQYGTISRECKPHAPVFKAIERHSIPLDSLYSNSTKPIDGLLVGFESLQDKEKEEEQERETETEGFKSDGFTPLPSNGISDSEWRKSLASNAAYEGIDVEREFAKMGAWCQLNRKQPSRRRFLNWLNRAERPMAGVSAGTNPHQRAAPTAEDHRRDGFEA